eukprot:318384-Pelagomonas_calceolata.AAC.1
MTPLSRSLNKSGNISKIPPFGASVGPLWLYTQKIRGLVPSSKPHSNITVNCANNLRCLDHSPHNPPGCGWDYVFTAYTLDQYRRLRVDPQRSTKLARKLHAHTVQYAHQLISIRRAIENKSTRHNSGALGPHAARNPPDSR